MLVCFVSTLVVCCFRLLILAVILADRAVEDDALAAATEVALAAATEEALAAANEEAVAAAAAEADARLAVSFSLSRASCRP